MKLHREAETDDAYASPTRWIPFHGARVGAITGSDEHPNTIVINIRNQVQEFIGAPEPGADIHPHKHHQEIYLI